MSIKETVVLEVNAETQQAVSSVKELNSTIQKTTKEIEDLRNKKLDDAAKTVTALSAAYGGLQGALELTGLAGDDTMKQLAKIQSALAIGDAVQNMMEFGGSIKRTFSLFTQLSVVQKTSAIAQRIWNAAMSANPLGAIIVAITALVAGIVMLIKYLRDSSNAAEEQASAINKSSKAIAEQKKALDESIETTERKRKLDLALAKASGMSADALRKKEKATINESIATAENSAKTALNTLEKAKNYLATLKQADADDELIKKQEENVKNARDILKTANDNIIKLGKERQEIYDKQRIDEAQAETDANKKKKEEAKKNSDEIKEANKKANEDILKLQQENNLLRIADERKRAEAKLEIDLETAKKDVQNSKASAELKSKQIKELEDKYMLDLRAMQSKNAEEDKKKKEEQDKKDAEDKKKKLDEQLKAEKETFDLVTQARLSQIKDAGVKRQEEEAIRYQNELDNLYNALNNKEITEADFNARREALKTLHEGNLTAIEKTNADERIKTAEAEYQAKVGIYTNMGNAMAQLGDAIGKTTKIGKALAFAQIAIDTGVAIAGVVRAASANRTNITPFQFIADIAIRTAAIINNIKKAKELLSSANVGGGGGGSLPSVSATAPVAPQMSSTALNQQMINQVGNATTRAFVVESDVSGNQERIRRLNRAARIN